jgi:acetate kinase
LASSDQSAALQRTVAFLKEFFPPPHAIAHRVVHGGAAVGRHCAIDDTVLRKLEEAAQFAPLHVPVAVAAIGFSREHFPGVLQIACLDTAFHADLPDVARVLPLPRELMASGVRRYGFHGISCESVLHRIGAGERGRIVIGHLGSGASVTAVRNGKSVDTSMGLTPTGGVIMSTRTGDIDPGAIVYLLRSNHLDACALEEITDGRSGLRGISALSGDMRVLRGCANSNPAAKLAIEMFCYSVRKQIAAMAGALGGVDLLVFTGGIGENDFETRSEICAGLDWMGLTLDEARNRCAANLVSHPDSRCRIVVVPSCEEEQMARIALRLHPAAG